MGAWRLIVDAEASGRWNMGVDEALLRSAQQGGLATLRFYRWSGPWLSLGYAQRLPAPAWRALAQAGVQAVRRATGGRAVLHGADLTYCVAAPESALPAGLRPSYALLAAALAEATLELGVRAQRVAKRPAAPGAPDFDCFAAPAYDELCADGRKLIGSAQRRSGGALLQHGSIRVAPDPPAAAQAAGLSPGVATSLREQGCDASLEGITEVFTGAFARVLGVRLVAEVLSAQERTQAALRQSDPPAEFAPAAKV